MPESDQRVSALPSRDDGGRPFSTGNRVKSARASFRQVAAWRSLGRACENISRPVTEATKSPATPAGALDAKRSIESLWKIRDLSAIVAPNLPDATCVMRALRDARDRGVIYITK
jgi:hypothetical protein